MEQIGQVINKAKLEGLQPLTMFNEQLQKLNLLKDSEAVKYAAIVLVIRDVENKKQIHLSEDERHGLAVELVRLNESIETTMHRAKEVIRNIDYGRISLDIWLNVELPLPSEWKCKCGYQAHKKDHWESHLLFTCPLNENNPNRFKTK